MKTSILSTLVIAGLAWASVAGAMADEKTITGLASCDKDHATVIKVENAGTTVTYHVVQNEAAKKFHGKICHKGAKVKATGNVKEADGRWQLELTKIELAEK